LGSGEKRIEQWIRDRLFSVAAGDTTIQKVSNLRRHIDARQIDAEAGAQ
jgi:hypothetical protein